MSRRQPTLRALQDSTVSRGRRTSLRSAVSSAAAPALIAESNGAACRKCDRCTCSVFISHGGRYRQHVDATRDFLNALGFRAIVVRDLPNLNRSVGEKVQAAMKDCVAAIALATSEDETIAHEHRARPNVEHEIGLLQSLPNIANRIVYLREPDVKFASNYSEKAWIDFSKEHIDRVWTALVRELVGFGLVCGPRQSRA